MVSLNRQFAGNASLMFSFFFIEHDHGHGHSHGHGSHSHDDNSPHMMEIGEMDASSADTCRDIACRVCFNRPV